MAGSIKGKHTIQKSNMQEITANNCDDNNNTGKKNQNCQLAGSSDDVLSNYSQKSDIIFISLKDDTDTADEGMFFKIVE